MKRRVKTVMNWILVDNGLPLPTTDIAVSNHISRKYYKVGAEMRFEGNTSGTVDILVYFSYDCPMYKGDLDTITNRVQGLVADGTLQGQITAVITTTP